MLMRVELSLSLLVTMGNLIASTSSMTIGLAGGLARDSLAVLDLIVGVEQHHVDVSGVPGPLCHIVLLCYRLNE